MSSREATTPTGGRLAGLHRARTGGRWGPGGALRWKEVCRRGAPAARERLGVSALQVPPPRFFSFGQRQVHLQAGEGSMFAASPHPLQIVRFGLARQLQQSIKPGVFNTSLAPPISCNPPTLEPKRAACPHQSHVHAPALHPPARASPPPTPPPPSATWCSGEYLQLGEPRSQSGAESQ
jgi:hypothetical protein